MQQYNDELKLLTPQLFDQGTLVKDDQLLPFALTDVFTSIIETTRQPLIHFWQFEKTVILGMKDSRVPFFTDAVKDLFEKKYNVILRNSGGLGIVSDEGVLNVSFILPNFASNHLEIAQAYELVTELIRRAFKEYPVTIDAKEISDSYCPGTYDLSINGKKFAGLAQRRIKDGVSIMLYLSVNGSQEARGRIMRDFYQVGLKENFGTNGYPPVAPESMANLPDLLGTTLSIEDIKETLISTFQSYFERPIENSLVDDNDLSELIFLSLQKQLTKMTQRNELIQEIQGGNQ